MLSRFENPHFLRRPAFLSSPHPLLTPFLLRGCCPILFLNIYFFLVARASTPKPTGGAATFLAWSCFDFNESKGEELEFR